MEKNGETRKQEQEIMWGHIIWRTMYFAAELQTFKWLFVKNISFLIECNKSSENQIKSDNSSRYLINILHYTFEIQFDSHLFSAFLWQQQQVTEKYDKTQFWSGFIFLMRLLTVCCCLLLCVENQTKFDYFSLTHNWRLFVKLMQDKTLICQRIKWHLKLNSQAIWLAWCLQSNL